MTKTAVAPDERDEKIARLEKQVGDLVDAIVELASQRPYWFPYPGLPCGLPHYPQQGYYPIYPWNQIPSVTYIPSAAVASGTSWNLSVIDATGANTLVG